MLMGVFKRKKKSTSSVNIEVGQRAKITKERAVGVIGRLIMIRIPILPLAFTPHLCLGNNCFLTWMPCNHICILFYHPAVSPNTINFTESPSQYARDTGQRCSNVFFPLLIIKVPHVLAISHK